MNERIIKELAEQARSYADQQWLEAGYPIGDPIYSKYYTKDYNEKFAQLIVQQCIAIVDEYGDSDEGNHIAYQIEQHFGVKE